jgi:hypothetical protein
LVGTKVGLKVVKSVYGWAEVLVEPMVAWMEMKMVEWSEISPAAKKVGTTEYWSDD